METSSSRTDTSKAVDRALALLESLSISDSPAGTRELARSLAYPLSATHRLLATLELHGFVRKDPKSEKYSLGPKILHLGARLLDQLDFRSVAIPIMREIRDRCDETVDLFVADGLERVCVECIQSRQNVRWVASVGTHLPIHAGAAGKILLAHLPEEQLEAVLSSSLAKITEATITDTSRLRQELDAICSTGWARSVEEGVVGNACVAAPIWGGVPPRVLASLSIAVPIGRFTTDREQLLMALVREGADRVSTTLGAEVGGRRRRDEP